MGGGEEVSKYTQEWTGRHFVEVRVVQEIREKWLRGMQGDSAVANGVGNGEQDEEEEEEEDAE